MVYEQAYLDQDHGTHAMNSLSELWKKQILCDATVYAGRYQINVHKTVLLVASPTLLSLCQNGGKQGHLQIQLPINLRGSTALHCFITYLYEGLLNLNEDCVMEVLNIASYLQVESVVKFCLSYLDCAKEQNVTLKAALSSPYDTCLYKVLNESLAKKFEPNVITSTSMKEPGQDSQSKQLPSTSCSSDDLIVINTDVKEKNYINNAIQKSQVVSSSQGRGDIPFKISDISSEAIQVKYIIDDDDDKDAIEQHNPNPQSPGGHFIGSENRQSFSFSQKDDQSCTPDSMISNKNTGRNALIVSTSRSNPMEIDLDSNSSSQSFEIHDVEKEEKLVIGKIDTADSNEKMEYICTICQTSFVCAENVVSHLRNMHNTAMNEVHEHVVVGSYSTTPDSPAMNTCEVCGFNSRKTDYLPYHCYFQHGIALPTSCKLFKCDSCNQEFILRRDLFDHRQQFHSTEANFVCEHCTRAYSTNSRLQRHIYNCHNSTRKCSCHYCGQMFNKQEHLKVHIRLHTHEKPFPCHVCDYKSTTKGNLKSHLIRRHSIDIETLDHFKTNRNKNQSDAPPPPPSLPIPPLSPPPSSSTDIS